MSSKKRKKYSGSTCYNNHIKPMIEGKAGIVPSLTELGNKIAHRGNVAELQGGTEKIILDFLGVSDD